MEVTVCFQFTGEGTTLSVDPCELLNSLVERACAAFRVTSAYMGFFAPGCLSPIYSDDAEGHVSVTALSDGCSVVLAGCPEAVARDISDGSLTLAEAPVWARDGAGAVEAALLRRRAVRVRSDAAVAATTEGAREHATLRDIEKTLIVQASNAFRHAGACLRGDAGFVLRAVAIDADNLLSAAQACREDPALVAAAIRGGLRQCHVTAAVREDEEVVRALAERAELPVPT